MNSLTEVFRKHSLVHDKKNISLIISKINNNILVKKTDVL